MTACILTVIKNEHQYLDEWIQYHLGIGVNHIFIFEDVDSDSHRSVTDKYNDYITLINISSILSTDEVNHVKRLKITKSQNPQEIYLKNALQYLRDLNLFNWCFVIDIDEFITFEKIDDSLDKLLSLYTDYDAIILQWQCYGASGRVKKPNYNGSSVIDTYTKLMPGNIPTKSRKSYTKTVYNLTTFNKEFFWYTHQPSSKCNYCRTDFSKDREKEIFNNIYLRHYITKSWEEYVWKKKERGYLYGKVRTLDAFFNINPDLLPLKKALLSSETLVVLPYSSRGSQGHELSFALNGWRKFCQFNYRFVIIGNVNEQIKQEFPWIEFIDIPPTSRVTNQYYPHIDIQYKMEKAYELFHNRYDGFIWMVDDNYAIRPFSQFDILQTHYLNSSFTGVESMATSCWKHDKWKTRQLLDQDGLPHMNYTTHFPCYFRFDWLKDIWDKYNMRENSYVVEDIYFNSHRVAQPLPVNDIRYGVWGLKQMGAPLEAALADPNIKFLCNSVEGWSPELEQILESTQ